MREDAVFCFFFLGGGEGGWELEVVRNTSLQTLICGVMIFDFFIFLKSGKRRK